MQRKCGTCAYYDDSNHEPGTGMCCWDNQGHQRYGMQWCRHWSRTKGWDDPVIKEETTMSGRHK